MSVLPPRYYWFFSVVEPTLSLLGAIYAIVDPEKYANDLLPGDVERLTAVLGKTTRGQMLIGALGSCFFLLSLISFFFFPTVKRHLSAYPVIQEKVVRNLLIPLAICDVLHIIVTLLPLPISLFYSPSRWTTTIHGNVTITLVLFIVRMLWFAGVGRNKQQPKSKPGSEQVATAKGASEGSGVTEVEFQRTESVTTPITPATPAAVAGEGGSPRSARRRTKKVED